VTRTDLSELDDALADHLRRTLRSVASTVDHSPTDPRVTPAPHADTFRLSGATTSNRIRRERSARAIILAAVAAVAIVALAIAVAPGPTRVDPALPARPVPDEAPDGTETVPDDALASGTAQGGGRWWVEPTASQPWISCPPIPGVELHSTRGQSTGGLPLMEARYTGAWPDDLINDCPDRTAWLADPTQFDMQAGRTANQWRDPDAADWVVLLAVHPDIRRITFSSDSQRTNPDQGTETFPLPTEADGPRFAAFRVPRDATTVEVRLLDSAGGVVEQRTKSLEDCCPS
jgi:hypothetical protein